jgi:hypothetical protein
MSEYYSPECTQDSHEWYSKDILTIEHQSLNYIKLICELELNQIQFITMLISSPVLFEWTDHR